jgi:hypothetical protein
MVPTGMTGHGHAFDAREGLAAGDNEAGWRSSLGKLAALVEAQ